MTSWWPQISVRVAYWLLPPCCLTNSATRKDGKCEGKWTYLPVQQAIRAKSLWPKKERLQRQTAKGWNETWAAFRSNSDGLFIVTDKMKINISHVCVRLRGEHKPYCDFNEPWPCWTGLTNEVSLPVDDPGSRSDAAMSFTQIFFVCRFLELKRTICQFLCTVIILQWIFFFSKNKLTSRLAHFTVKFF